MAILYDQFDAPTFGFPVSGPPAAAPVVSSLDAALRRAHEADAIARNTYLAGRPGAPASEASRAADAIARSTYYSAQNPDATMPRVVYPRTSTPRLASMPATTLAQLSGRIPMTVAPTGTLTSAGIEGYQGQRTNPFTVYPVGGSRSGPLGVAALPTMRNSMPLTPGLVKGAPGSGWSYLKGPGYSSVGYGPSSGSLTRDPTNRFADPRLNNAASLAYLNMENWDFVEAPFGQGGGQMVPNQQKIMKEAQSRVAASEGGGGSGGIPSSGVVLRPGLAPVPSKYSNVAVGDTMGGAMGALQGMRALDAQVRENQAKREQAADVANAELALNYEKLRQSRELGLADLALRGEGQDKVYAASLAQTLARGRGGQELTPAQKLAAADRDKRTALLVADRADREKEGERSKLFEAALANLDQIESVISQRLPDTMTKMQQEVAKILTDSKADGVRFTGTDAWGNPKLEISGYGAVPENYSAMYAKVQAGPAVAEWKRLLEDRARIYEKRRSLETQLRTRHFSPSSPGFGIEAVPAPGTVGEAISNAEDAEGY
jgi:hypothetical protein